MNLQFKQVEKDIDNCDESINWFVEYKNLRALDYLYNSYKSIYLRSYLYSICDTFSKIGTQKRKTKFDRELEQYERDYEEARKEALYEIRTSGYFEPGFDMYLDED